MSENIIIISLYNPYEEPKIIERPKTYPDLLNILSLNEDKDKFIIFYLSSNDKEIEINNNEDYELSKDILYIRKKPGLINIFDISKMNLAKTIYALNYEKMPELIQEKLDDKFNCSICQMIIKKENPFFCYI